MRKRWLIVLPWLLGAGWRGDGTGRNPQATPPEAWTTPTWKITLPASGTSSPVGVGDVIAVTGEPTQLMAVSKASGQILWRRSHPVTEVLPADLRGIIEPMVKRLAGADKTLASLQAEYSQDMRLVRSGRSDLSGELTRLSAEIASLKADLEVARPYLTPPTSDMIGYASPTPATDGSAIFALFGNGVVTAYEADGRRRWGVWLGADDDKRRGYQGTCGASPIVVGDLLIVPYRELVALSLRDGHTVWRGPKWPHYGTPTATDVDGHTVLVAPDGAVLDARTGRVLATGLGDIVYLGPGAMQGEVWYLGNNVGFDQTAPNHAIGLRLRWAGDKIEATRSWERLVMPQDRFYATPVWADNRLFSVSKRRELLVLDATTGEVLADRQLSDRVEEEVWGSPQVVGGRLFVPTTKGRIWEFSTAPPFDIVREVKLDPGYSTPWFEGSSAYWRGEKSLVRFDR